MWRFSLFSRRMRARIPPGARCRGLVSARRRLPSCASRQVLAKDDVARSRRDSVVQSYCRHIRLQHVPVDTPRPSSCGISPSPLFLRATTQSQTETIPSVRITYESSRGRSPPAPIWSWPAFSPFADRDAYEPAGSSDVRSWLLRVRHRDSPRGRWELRQTGAQSRRCHIALSGSAGRSRASAPPKNNE